MAEQAPPEPAWADPVLEQEGPGRWLWILASVVASLLLHVAVGVSVAQIEVREPPEPEWVEMAVQDVTPAPVPEPEPEVQPEPEPEPQPVPDEPETVEYQEPEPVAPQPVKPVPVPVQGLNNDSFLEGTGGGAVRAGNTTGVAQTKETMTLDEADDSVLVPYGAVTTPPKIRFKGTLEVPDSVRAAGIEGRVEVLLTVDAEGKVTDVQVTGPLDPEADAACVASVKKTRWKPGDKAGAPVVTTGVPYFCTFKMMPG
ncbi:MAG: energy transducer TonB [Myxococcota bacterium]